ncbi:MAG TPA: hypothetical protein GX728_04365 [Clostridiaceae bacterium]|nr:hypothetical protein [Clostridiaceae bacterium]
MSRFAKTITILILLSLAVPLAGLAFGLDSPNYSKEPLAPFPTFRLDSEYGPQFDRWWSDHFPFRSAIVTAYHKCLGALTGVSGSDQVVKGREGWYFFTPTIRDYVRSDYLDTRDAAKIARSWEIQRRYVEESGRSFIICVAPNKSTVYPEFMPSWIRIVGEKRPIEYLKAMVSDECYLEDVLLQEKETAPYHLYHREDTHWNLLGSYVAYREVLSRLFLSDRSLSFGEPRVEAEGWEGDLTNMLFPALRSSGEDIVFSGNEKEYTAKRPMRSPEDPVIETINGTKEGTVLMFRDSFANAWIDFFSNTFRTVHYSHVEPYRYDLLEEVDPDYVILEFAERNLDRMLLTTPELDAPQAFEIDGALRQVGAVGGEIEYEKRHHRHFYNFLPHDRQWAKELDAVQLFDGQSWYEAFPIYEQKDVSDNHRLYGFSLYTSKASDWSRIRYRTTEGWYEAVLDFVQ